MKIVSRAVSRTEFLALLESVAHGLSSRDIIEQSSCFVFSHGEVMTYNDEVACRMATNLKLKGAVQAAPLLAILQKLPDDELQLATKKGKFVMQGKRRETSIRMEKEVLLPIKNVEKPKKWKKLHPDFVDAIEIAHECTGKDESKFWTTCVHIHPDWIEACDDAQVTRYKMPTGIRKSTLVRGKAIKCIKDLDVRRFSETPTWLHFKNKAGLIISCRRYVEDYPVKDLTRILKVSGTRTQLPKGLMGATDRADVFSSENADNNLVLVELRPGRLKVRGEGVSGDYTEYKKLRYKGEPLEFLIAPKLLQELTRRHNECEITEDRLKVNGGKFQYVSCLSKVGDPEDVQEEQDEGSEEDDGGDD